MLCTLYIYVYTCVWKDSVLIVLVRMWAECLRTIWTGVHRPHRKWGFQGGFLPHSTSTVEVNSGDKIVWEIFISVREKVQVREMQESSCLEDHIINLMRWRVNYLVPVAAPVCTLVYYFSGLCIGYISYGSGSYRKVNTGKFTNGVESHHLWICSGKYTSFIIDICVCNQCSL